ncbi:MAG: voltage-gated potassium channel [Candidatus Marinimicrobia bacterium]|nr:voltage-gated potassium channel [Candidatus Neomarinimicrobiota bacterium]
MNTKYLRKIVFENDFREGRYFDYSIQTLIVLSLITFSLETIPNLNDKVLKGIAFFELFSIIIFTFEYLLRIFLSKKKLKYIFSFYGIIDVLAILPFYLNNAIDLRSIRIFRLFRLLRTLKLFRDGNAVKTFTLAYEDIKAELMMFSTISLFIIYVSSMGIYYFENDLQPDKFGSIFHCLWWATVTLTSVGYGDAYPITIGGKIFTSIIIIIGIGIIAVPTGLIASAMTKISEDNKQTK